MNKLLTLIVVFMVAGGGGLAWAQGEAKVEPAGEKSQGSAAKAPEGDTKYKATTVYDFDDDNVEGDLQRPDGEQLQSVQKVKHTSLIEIRKDFVPEMLKSLEDI
jgi:hypothetical protein